jgi:hypothetical protein
LHHHLHFADDAVAFGTCGPFVIAIWRGAPRRAHHEIALTLIADHARATGRAIGVVTVVEEGSPPPDAEDLPFLLARFEALAGSSIRAVAAAFEAVAESADLRNVAESVGGAFGKQVSVKMCFAPEEACAWILPRALPEAVPEDRVELAAAVEQIRSKILSPAR